MRPHTLRFKVGVWLATSLTGAMLVFALLVVRYQRDQLLEAAVEHVTQLSEVITKSTRFKWALRRIPGRDSAQPTHEGESS
jgi:hypothetical protein